LTTKRKRLREKRKRKQLAVRLTWWIAGLIVIGMIGYILWVAVRPAAGKSVAIMPNSSDHAEVGEDPGSYSTDPPTSGPHYPSDLEPGFYTESDLGTYGPYPEGFLVHNLEHGYVIFWYNCRLLDEQECQDLSEQIKGVMDDVDNFKVIAFPRHSIQFPVVMTSWGQMMEFERFDPGQAEEFVIRNRNKAPEPNAD
jgi:hypothetical protein